MAKLVLANIPGHYEGSGIEVDISTHQIVIRTTNQPQPHQHNQDKKNKPQGQKQQREPENMSLLSSLSTIAQRIKK